MENLNEFNPNNNNKKKKYFVVVGVSFPFWSLLAVSYCLNKTNFFFFFSLLTKIKLFICLLRDEYCEINIFFVLFWLINKLRVLNLKCLLSCVQIKAN